MKMQWEVWIWKEEKDAKMNATDRLRTDNFDSWQKIEWSGHNGDKCAQKIGKSMM